MATYIPRGPNNHIITGMLHSGSNLENPTLPNFCNGSFGAEKTLFSGKNVIFGKKRNLRNALGIAYVLPWSPLGLLNVFSILPRSLALESEAPKNHCMCHNLLCLVSRTSETNDISYRLLLFYFVGNSRSNKHLALTRYRWVVRTPTVFAATRRLTLDSRPIKSSFCSQRKVADES